LRYAVGCWEHKYAPNIKPVYGSWKYRFVNTLGELLYILYQRPLTHHYPTRTRNHPHNPLLHTTTALPHRHSLITSTPIPMPASALFLFLPNQHDISIRRVAVFLQRVEGASWSETIAAASINDACTMATESIPHIHACMSLTKNPRWFCPPARREFAPRLRGLWPCTCLCGLWTLPRA
jgi:hypothetical protein